MCIDCAIFVYNNSRSASMDAPHKINNMCVIIVKQNDKQLSRTILRTASKNNPDGLGVVFLDTFEVNYHKSKDWKRLVTTRPFIAHFRYATKGKVNKANTHPFVCGKNKHELLMHNGTIPFLGDEKTCDSKVLANELGNMPRHTWKEELSLYDSRFVTINTRTRRFQRYNKDLWTQHSGTFYSNDRSIKNNLVAVYGTLKKGNGNYYSYLRDETYIGKGFTTRKFPMIIPGLPYVIDKPGKGHLINIDLFAVSDNALKELDSLEGHPTHYKRREITVRVKKKIYKAWLYFGQNKDYVGEKLYSTYERPTPQFKVRSYPLGNYTFADAQPYIPAHRRAEGVEADTHWWEEDTTLKAEECKCPDCFQKLDYDGFNEQYYCHQCTQYFSEEEVKKFRV